MFEILNLNHNILKCSGRDKDIGRKEIGYKEKWFYWKLTQFASRFIKVTSTQTKMYFIKKMLGGHLQLIVVWTNIHIKFLNLVYNKCL